MSGLAAGIRLAYYDQRVCILERHTTIGGLNSFYRLGGRNYDVGLHALTNYHSQTRRRGPLAMLLRQLRLARDEFALAPQYESAIAFPGVVLRFNNDPLYFRSQIAERFPADLAGYDRLVEELIEYEQADGVGTGVSAREQIGRFIQDPLLVDMLFCPLMFYGSARERDIDWDQFCILFRSIFLEGLGRPFAGVRRILKSLVRQFKSLGGELRLRSGVSRLCVRDKRVAEVELMGGERLAARQVLSSAGWVETMRLCDDGLDRPLREAGRLSFCETIATLDVEPRDLGLDRTIVFFNNADSFRWERPDDLCDPQSGVICVPNNFQYDRPMEEGTIRVTALANYDRWAELAPEEYRLEKLRWYDRLAAAAVGHVPEYRHRVIDTDMFTPTTIERYTGHRNGAVYGAPCKQRDGTTHLSNLFVCCTDQGLVGIIGSLISGISIANRHLLR
jgi:phytoene dehydrogenase-like protein